ncbi:MAG: hypothetical protein IKX10_10450 [Lachnospiraceae bacterium]|nr:hypothetical protein [Lachnospiraceae bacterium]
MSEKDAKNRLMEGIGEVDDAYYQEAEYTNEELKRLNRTAERKTEGGAAAVTETSEQEAGRLEEQLRESSMIEKEGAEICPEAAPKRKAATIIWITAGVALAAAAILLFVFLWNPDRSDVVTTTEAESTKEPEVGDYITLGHFEQDNDSSNGAEGIEWRVLAKEDDRILVISRYGLDCRPYNTKEKDVTWETCSLRKWINGSFYDEAFSSKEKKMILTTKVEAETNPELAPGGKDTNDKLFLLSFDEVYLYFDPEEDSLCPGTPYCYARGATEDPSMIKLGIESCCYWWLRTPGLDASTAAHVCSGGVITEIVNQEYIAVRPAMWIQSGRYDVTGTVTPIPLRSAETWRKEEVNTVQISDAQVGDYIKFGSYEQDNDLENGAEDVEWLVLDKQDDRLLVISRYGLDDLPYNTEEAGVTWETCSLRKWLNSTFYETAFAPGEKDSIADSLVKADPNPEYDAPAGNDTTDRVFVLSIDEAERYFADNMARTCLGTPYSETQGVSIFVSIAASDEADKYNGNCSWVLRTPGETSDMVAFVYSYGRIRSDGSSVTNKRSSFGDYAIRPAMWIKIKP